MRGTNLHGCNVKGGVCVCVLTRYTDDRFYQVLSHYLPRLQKAWLWVKEHKMKSGRFLIRGNGWLQFLWDKCQQRPCTLNSALPAAVVTQGAEVSQTQQAGRYTA